MQGDLLIAVILIIFCVFFLIGFLVYYNNRHHSSYEEPDTSNILVELENVTPFEQTIKVGSFETLLQGNESVKFNLTLGDIIETINNKGVSHKLKIADKNTKQYQVHYNGIGKKLERETKYINTSTVPIIFIHKAKGGRRWPLVYLKGNDSLISLPLSKGFTIQVVHEQAENYPIDEITLSSPPDEIMFDGQHLYAL